VQIPFFKVHYAAGFHPVNMGIPGSTYSHDFWGPVVNTGTPFCLLKIMMCPTLVVWVQLSSASQRYLQ